MVLKLGKTWSNFALQWIILFIVLDMDYEVHTGGEQAQMGLGRNVISIP